MFTQHQWKSSSSHVKSLCSFERATEVIRQVTRVIIAQLLSLSAQSTHDGNGANDARVNWRNIQASTTFPPFATANMLGLSWDRPRNSALIRTVPPKTKIFVRILCLYGKNRFYQGLLELIKKYG